MDVVDAALGSSDRQAATVELNLVPSQPAHFRRAQSVVEGERLRSDFAMLFNPGLALTVCKVGIIELCAEVGDGMKG
jgi:hypothetical protein